MVEKPQFPESIPQAPSTESAPSVEQKAEQPAKPTEKPNTMPAQGAASPMPATTQQQGIPAVKSQKSETLERIEDIMEEDLQEMFQGLSPEDKKAFKEKGEETAAELESMMHRVKLKSKEVFKLLFGWMKIIPRVNRYFLKQEAKIKTDEIMHVKEELDKASRGQIET